jgi:two-component system phosphate regulon response regulator PhoB
VVDDDLFIGEMLKFMLSAKGYLVDVSTKPEQTVDNILKNGIHLVMLDYFIFETSGIEICLELKRNKTTTHVPILMMSGQSTLEKQCLTAGATDIISKPFEMLILFSKIETILKQIKA